MFKLMDKKIITIFFYTPIMLIWTFNLLLHRLFLDHDIIFYY